MNVAMTNGLIRNDEASGLKSLISTARKGKPTANPRAAFLQSTFLAQSVACKLQVAAEQHGPGSKVGLGPMFARVASFVGAICELGPGSGLVVAGVGMVESAYRARSYRLRLDGDVAGFRLGS